VLGLVTISLFGYILFLPWFTGHVRSLHRNSIADREVVGIEYVEKISYISRSCEYYFLASRGTRYTLPLGPDEFHRHRLVNFRKHPGAVVLIRIREGCHRR
jgi:hypothetical protein